MLVTALCIFPATFINIILEVCTRGDIHRAFYTELRCFSQSVAATIVFFDYNLDIHVIHFHYFDFCLV